jgi:hypothetical protein
MSRTFHTLQEINKISREREEAEEEKPAGRARA